MKSQYKFGLGVSIYASFVILILTVAAIRRGAWGDEFYSLWVNDGRIPFESARIRWLEDTHPPLYSALLYSMSKLLPINIITGRLLNLVPLLFAVAVLSYLYLNDKRMRRFIIFFAALLTSSYYFMAYFTEFRSYFTGLCAFAILVALLQKIFNDMSEAEDTRNGVWVCVFITIFICLNIHYVTAVFTAIVVATFGIVLLLKSRAAYFVRLLSFGIILSVPLVIFVFAQRAYLQNSLTASWLDVPEPTFLLKAIGVKTIAPLLPSILLVTWLIVHRRRAGAAFFTLMGTRRLLFSLILAIAATICAIIVSIVNLRFPIVQDRMLIPIIILCLAIMANVFDVVGLRWPLFTPVFVANCILCILLFGVKVSEQERWYASAKLVKTQLDRCPSSRVVAREWRTIPVPKNTDSVVKVMFEYTANEFHIPGNNLTANAASGLRSACPDIIWILYEGDLKSFMAHRSDYVLDAFLKKNRDYDGYNAEIEYDPKNTAMVITARKPPQQSGGG